jgi:hypothetical protein
VEKHSQYNQQVSSFKDWLAEQSEKLQDYNVVNGEKNGSGEEDHSGQEFERE